MMTIVPKCWCSSYQEVYEKSLYRTIIAENTLIFSSCTNHTTIAIILLRGNLRARMPAR